VRSRGRDQPPQRYARYVRLSTSFESCCGWEVDSPVRFLSTCLLLQRNAGNITFRACVKACQPAYIEAKRREKPYIAQRIVVFIRKMGAAS
jgi:hypothetical protein